MADHRGQNRRELQRRPLPFADRLDLQPQIVEPFERKLSLSFVTDSTLLVAGFVEDLVRLLADTSLLALQFLVQDSHRT